MFHIIRRKKQIEFGDEMMLIWDVMFRAQTYIQMHLQDSEQVSFFSAQDVYLVTKTIEKLNTKEQQALVARRNKNRSLYSLCYAFDQNPIF